MSRQTASRILSSLVSQNFLVKTGSTLTARYHKPKKGETPKYPLQLKLRKKLKKLQEDEVFKTAALKLNLQKKLPENVYRIAYYAFCEMLNNAIDHSNSKEATIRAQVGQDGFEFWIRDEGVGVFHRIQVGHHLKSEEEAVEHLLKGKQTTAPEAHSGQGDFFHLKNCRLFSIEKPIPNSHIRQPCIGYSIRRSTAHHWHGSSFSHQSSLQKKTATTFRRVLRRQFRIRSNQILRSLCLNKTALFHDHRHGA